MDVLWYDPHQTRRWLWITGYTTNPFLLFAGARRDLDTKTLKAYRIDLTQLLVHLDSAEDKITRERICAYMSHLNEVYKPHTIVRKIATIKVFVAICTMNDCYTKKPFKICTWKACKAKSFRESYRCESSKPCCGTHISIYIVQKPTPHENLHWERRQSWLCFFPLEYAPPRCAWGKQHWHYWRSRKKKEKTQGAHHPN